MSEPTQCPADETLAAFVEGSVDARTRARVLAHIENCTECMAVVLSANAHLDEERRGVSARTSRRWWLAIAAALLITIVAMPLLRRKSEPLARLVALAPHSARLVEPRLSGGFAWAEYAGTERA
ncbi:MAG: hypothetical protein QOE68_3356, partial [Thermoanaerobaculia bacterium]|nr:hypothetical protein [Thermoanaerobaculia bacterium]